MAKSQAGQSAALSRSKWKQLKKMAENMSGERKQLEQQAIKPLETTATGDAAHHGSSSVSSSWPISSATLPSDSNRSQGSTDANDPDVERRVAELEAEQQQLRESLGNLLDDIAAQADALPDVRSSKNSKPPPRNSANEVRESQAQPRWPVLKQKLARQQLPRCSR